MPDTDDKEDRASQGDGGGRTRPRGRARTRLTDAERDRIRELAAEGLSVREIARQVGRSADAVSRLTRDVANDRRAQTAAATRAKSLDLAAERVKLMEQTLGFARLGMRRFASDVQPGDHRGSRDEAQAAGVFIGLFAKLSDQHARAQGSQGMNDVDAWLAAMAGAPDAELMPDDGPEP